MIQSGKVFFNILLLTSLNDIGAWQELPSLELSQILFNLPVLTWYLMLASSIGLTPAAFLFIIIFLILTWGYVYWFERERERERESEKERERKKMRERMRTKHLCQRETSISCVLYALWPGNEITTLWCMDDAPTNWATQPGPCWPGSRLAGGPQDPVLWRQ